MADDINNFLRSSAQKGDLESLVHYVQNGADVNSRDRNSSTALHFASFEGHDMLVKRLINAGASVDAINRNGQASLHLAASKGHGGVVARLLKANCDPQIKTKYSGMTALHLASQNSHREVVLILLSDDGTDSKPVDKFGRTPEDYICADEIKRVFVSYYRKHGALLSGEVPRDGVTRTPLMSKSAADKSVLRKGKKKRDKKQKAKSEVKPESDKIEQHESQKINAGRSSLRSETVAGADEYKTNHQSDGVEDTRSQKDNGARVRGHSSHQLSGDTLEHRFKENTTVNEAVNINYPTYNQRMNRSPIRVTDEFDDCEVQLNYEKHTNRAKGHAGVTAGDHRDNAVKSIRLNYDMKFSQQHVERMSKNVFTRLVEYNPKYSHNMKP